MTVAQLVDNDWNAGRERRGGGGRLAARIVRRGQCVVEFLPFAQTVRRRGEEEERRGEERAHPLGTSAPHFCPLFYCISLLIDFFFSS